MQAYIFSFSVATLVRYTTSLTTEIDNFVADGLVVWEKFRPVSVELGIY
jgi:hypothetical protein